MRASLAGWLCLAVAACAGSTAERAAAPATSSAAPQAMPPEDPRAEITRLSTEIAQQQQQTSAATPMAAGGSQACSDVCTLSSSICKNADRICELADGMPGDDWAAGKCRDAKQSCTDAKQRCTDCS